MSLRTAFRIYPKAIMWSVIISSSIIMEGYDTATIGNCETSFHHDLPVDD